VYPVSTLIFLFFVHVFAAKLLQSSMYSWVLKNQWLAEIVAEKAVENL
jgi:hypothetical protein